MLKKLLASAGLCALVLSSPAAAQAPAAPSLPDADPAMWVVKDADTTVYLFGTFHGLDGKSDWFNDEVKAAFDQSSEVYVEAILPENQAEMQPLIMKYAVDGKTLSSRLPEATKAKYGNVMNSIGVPAQALDGYEPWFATMALTAIVGMKNGILPQHGADAVITKAAKAAGKKVGELEGAEFQLSLFDRMPEEKQVKQLDQALDQVPQMGPMLQAMMASWAKGDAEGISKLVVEGMAETPDLYKIIFSDRNATWADWIDKRMAQPGVVFVAVGTGHLVGQDSVQDLLAKKGHKSERVKN